MKLRRSGSAPYVAAVVLGLTLVAPAVGRAQPSLQGFALKIFRVDPVLYPFVQVYFRTFDERMEPLVNLNEMNIGIMVNGRSYDPDKRQYRLQSLRDRKQAIRSVVVLDASASMKGAPFEAAIRAVGRFIDSKRPQDQVAILAIRDRTEGYELVSTFDRDPEALARRLADVVADGQHTRLYDTVGAAMQMAALPPQGGGGEEDYIVSTSIIVFSDGHDEGSALNRTELNTRITSLALPIPIYSVAYSKIDPQYFRNLEALSKNSFGVYYEAGEALEHMQRVVEKIQNILQSDYVVTLRSYIEPDGREQNLKLGIEYPSRSGRVTYESAKFEAVEAPPIPVVQTRVAELHGLIPALETGNPYFDRNRPPGAPAGG